MQELNTLDWLALILVIVGALNWGLVGIFKRDLVGGLFGKDSSAARVIFTLVGIAGLYMIYLSTQLLREM